MATGLFLVAYTNDASTLGGVAQKGHSISSSKIHLPSPRTRWRGPHGSTIDWQNWSKMKANNGVFFLYWCNVGPAVNFREKESKLNSKSPSRKSIVIWFGNDFEYFPELQDLTWVQSFLILKMFPCLSKSPNFNSFWNEQMLNLVSLLPWCFGRTRMLTSFQKRFRKTHAHTCVHSRLFRVSLFSSLMFKQQLKAESFAAITAKGSHQVNITHLSLECYFFRQKMGLIGSQFSRFSPTARTSEQMLHGTKLTLAKTLYSWHKKCANPVSNFAGRKTPRFQLIQWSKIPAFDGIVPFLTGVISTWKVFSLVSQSCESFAHPDILDGKMNNLSPVWSCISVWKAAGISCYDFCLSKPVRFPPEGSARKCHFTCTQPTTRIE